MKKQKTKTKEVKWQSGVNFKSHMSYEKYLKAGLENISKHFSVRTYKLAPKSDYPIFERGKDLRVQIFWKKESKYEFIIEQSFWYQSNTNKDDRIWMRNHADIHLKAFYDAVAKGKEKSKKKKPTIRKVKKTAKVGSTQESFEKIKK